MPCIFWRGFLFYLYNALRAAVKELRMKLDKKQSGVPGIVNLPDPAPGKGGRKVVA